jgi:lysozyme family protein
MGNDQGNSQTLPGAQPVAPPPMASLDVALAFTLQNEGGFSDDPQDSGGPTSMGITQSDLSQYLGRQATVDDVRNMSLETATAIYKANYWSDGLSQLSQPVATAIFDFGVLHGTTSARKLAQSVANGLGASLAVDGVIGPASIAAINALPSKAFVQDYASAIDQVFASIVANYPKDQVFLKGWDNRAARIAALA